MTKLIGTESRKRPLGLAGFGLRALGGLGIGLLLVGCSSPASDAPQGAGASNSGGRASSGGTGGAGARMGVGASSAQAGTSPSGGGGSNSGGNSGTSTPATGSRPAWDPTAVGPQQVADKLDLLFVIDNSVSMADKQEALAQIVPQLVHDMVNPRCVDATRAAVAEQPASISDPCPLGSHRAMKPIHDMHVGVVSSSLGGHGGAICADGAQDDKGELIAPRRGLPIADGFLTWTGVEPVAQFQSQVTDIIRAAGETGCGYEATNESWYRFLIDPEPPASVTRVASQSQAQGTNATVLKQRAAFLRPDSAVMVVVLSDENDCSLRDDGYSWLVADQASPMPRARAICSEKPNDPCCRACADQSTPSECGTDATCAAGATKIDSANLRCMDQKRRFGLDLLYPIDRYVTGLTAPQVPNRAGDMVPNPLYVGGRDPSLVSYIPIVGVPWQDLAQSKDPNMPLRFKAAEQLEKENAWPALVGDLDQGIAPLDPFMQESVDPRTGTSPIFGGATEPPTAGYFASPVNGHEHSANQDRGDLQFACVFPLVAPRDCAAIGTDKGCDCKPEQSGTARYPDLPLCQSPAGVYGTTQYLAKAYPGIRHLELARRLGTLAVPASICSDFGAVLDGLKGRLEKLFDITLT